MPSLRELLATFDIDIDESALKAANEHIEGFKTVLKQAGEIVAEAFATEKIKEFVEQQIHAGAELKITAERLGIAIDEFQALELAAGEAGLSSEGLANGLRFLNRNIAEAIHGGGEQAKVFGQLHIALKNADGSTRGVGDVLGELADRIKDIPDAARQTQVAMELLGRHGAQLLPLLKQGSAGLEEARKQLEELGGGMSKEFVEQAHAAEAATVRLEFATKGLKSQIASALFPAFSELVGWFTHLTADLVRFNKETNVLTTGMAFFGTIAAFKAIGALKELVPLIEKLTTRLILADVSLFGFEIPLLLVIGALGLLYLAFDDVYTLMTGGESVIGDTIDELFGIGASVQFAKDLREAFSAFLDLLGNSAGILYNTLVTPFELAADLAKGLGKYFDDLVHGHFDKAWQDFSNIGTEQLADLQKRGSKILEGFRGIGEDFTESATGRRKLRDERLYQQAAGGAAVPAFAPGGALFTGPVQEASHVPTNIYGHPLAQAGGGGTVLHQENNTKVEVHTSSDQPKAVGDAVGQGVATAQQRAHDRARTALKHP